MAGDLVVPRRVLNNKQGTGLKISTRRLDREKHRIEHGAFRVQVHDSIGKHKVRRTGQISPVHGVASNTTLLRLVRETIESLR
ncbi:hypothetical protein [Nocardia sp. NBC_00403]|uniref:hypothetical protein n=1 Tax=Nocardia sp. NBC_00403 TaxID=2975990 RepID=UPI002E237098